ncbi:MAG: hypothetical protein MI975_02220 [Cytophagales bacterium]|nr:hypothetical protein [Cytophagales bacterium]
MKRFKKIPKLLLQKIMVNQNGRLGTSIFFWCENSGFTGERLAKEIEHLFKQNGFSGQIRVRYLAESVTRRKNFGKPADFEIRVDAGEELSSAEKILELIGKSSSIKKEEFNIFKVSEKSKIPGYVSLFFCP